MSNPMLVIYPYRYDDYWVFDRQIPLTESVELVREQFVSGMPAIIDNLVKDIPNAEKGFKLLLSLKPFPGHQAELVWQKEQYGGNWYRWEAKN